MNGMPAQAIRKPAEGGLERSRSLRGPHRDDPRLALPLGLSPVFRGHAAGENAKNFPEKLRLHCSRTEAGIVEDPSLEPFSRGSLSRPPLRMRPRATSAPGPPPAPAAPAAAREPPEGPVSGPAPPQQPQSPPERNPGPGGFRPLPPAVASGASLRFCPRSAIKGSPLQYFQK